MAAPMICSVTSLCSSSNFISPSLLPCPSVFFRGSQPRKNTEGTRKKSINEPLELSHPQQLELQSHRTLVYLFEKSIPQFLPYLDGRADDLLGNLLVQ